MQRHLVMDPVRGEVVAYSLADAASLLGVSKKTVQARCTSVNGRRAELTGWEPLTEANPNRGWMVDAAQVDALADIDATQLRAEMTRLHRELEATKSANAQLELQRESVQDERAVLEIERSTYQHNTLAAANAEIERLRAERDQARASVRTLGQTVASLTAQLASADL